MSKAEFLGAHQVDSSEEYIEVWNDLVSPRDLTLSLACCGGVTVAALIIATFLSSSLFFWGLGGAVAGFIICAVVFKPKRMVRIVGADGSAGTPDAVVADGASDVGDAVVADEPAGSPLSSGAVTGAAH